MNHMQASAPRFQLAQDEVGGKVKRLGLFLVAANIVVWAWAWLHLQGQAALLGTAVLAYSFGLRHALDADHIVAIDNVTRKLMQDGKRPVATGFFFALGHSMVVVLASILIAFTAKSFSAYLPSIQEYGGLLSAVISSTFLLVIGLFNVFLLLDLYRNYKSGKKGGTGDLNLEKSLKGNLLARLCAPLFGKISQSWQMMPLGFLFGLGFETATEVALLSTSAMHAAQGVDLSTILLFPALFTVGMLTVDAADGVLMLRVYGWAFVHPRGKLYYNMMLTFISTLLAFGIAGLGLASLFHEYFNLQGAIWHGVQAIQENYLMLGYIIIGVFLLSWLGSSLAYRMRSGGSGGAARPVD
jgi:high-affinity nickel-transport protein